MKTLFIFFLSISAIFAQTKDFQVIEVKPNGIIVQEVVIQYVSKAMQTEKYIVPEYPLNPHVRLDGTVVYLPPLHNMGGAASSYGSKKPVLLNDQYFIAKDNSNTFFKKDDRFNARFNPVKVYVKDGTKIELIKVQSYSAFIDTSKKKPPVIPSNIGKSPKNRKLSTK